MMTAAVTAVALAVYGLGGVAVGAAGHGLWHAARERRRAEDRRVLANPVLSGPEPEPDRYVGSHRAGSARGAAAQRHRGWDRPTEEFRALMGRTFSADELHRLVTTTETEGEVK